MTIDDLKQVQLGEELSYSTQTGERTLLCNVIHKDDKLVRVRFGGQGMTLDLPFDMHPERPVLQGLVRTHVKVVRVVEGDLLDLGKMVLELQSTKEAYREVVDGCVAAGFDREIVNRGVQTVLGMLKQIGVDL